MSVMSVGKKPRALIHPLRAGNSQDRVRGGQFRPADSGAPAARQEKQRVPGVSLPPPGTAAPAPPRGTRKSPARPRLWVVPDPPGMAAGAPLVPRPRVAPDDQIPSRPAVPAVAPAPGRPPGPGQAAAPSRARAARPASASSRVRAGGPASAPSRLPARRVRRTRLTRRGRRLVWASAVLLLVAVLTPVLLALASGAQAANHGAPPSAVRAAMRHVVVKPGQSLWSIALNAEPEADPRVVVQQIMDFNALGSQVVVPGESLWVPRG